MFSRKLLNCCGVLSSTSPWGAERCLKISTWRTWYGSLDGGLDWCQAHAWGNLKGWLEYLVASELKTAVGQSVYCHRLSPACILPADQMGPAGENRPGVSVDPVPESPWWGDHSLPCWMPTSGERRLNNGYLRGDSGTPFGRESSVSTCQRRCEQSGELPLPLTC